MSIFSLTGFAAELTRLAIEMPKATHAALEDGAQMIEEEAKKSLGEYQGGAGPFAAWAPLAESTLADKDRKGFDTPSPLLREGDMRDSIEHVVDGDKAFIGSNSDVAVDQELGTSRMPPRSFLGRAAAVMGEKIAKHTGRIAHSHLTGDGVRVPIE